MNKNKKLFVGVSIVMIILICVSFTVKSFQNDTFYSIKVGESIMKHGIDMKDHFSWHQLSYTYPHWLYDVITYQIYHHFDFFGLYVATILAFILVGVSFYLINLKLNKSYFISLFFSIITVIMIAQFAAARAQLMTYLLFLLEIFMIERLLQSGKKIYIVGLLIICLLIANLHVAVWPFYFVIMLPYFFEQIVFKIWSKFKNRPNFGIFCHRLELVGEKYIKYLFVTFLISLFVGLLTPNTFVPYTYFIQTILGSSVKYIEEHKPLVLIQNLFVVGYLVVLFVPLIFTKVRVRCSDFVMIIGLVIMSFLSVRHVALLGILGMFYLCRLICNIGKIRGKTALDFEFPLYGMFIVLVTVFIISGFVFRINSGTVYIDPNLYPVGMVSYMKDNLDLKTVKLYNDYDFGSYLIFHDIPVYIDSRADLYTKPFNHKFDIFYECMNITNNYGRVFKKYGITHILIYRDTELNHILAASPNYELVHKDGRFMLYHYLTDVEEE